MLKVQLQPPERDRYELLKKQVKENEDAMWKWANALAEIKARKLYREDHETFEAFCEAELHWTRQHATKFLGAAVIVAQLPAPERKKVVSVNAANALKRVPPAMRPAVVNAAAKSSGGKPVTEKQVRAATPKSATPPPRKAREAKSKPAAVKDGTGMVIPESLHSLWHRRTEANELVTYLSAIRGKVNRVDDQEKPDALFAEVNFGALKAALDQAFQHLCVAVPFAVCPTCQGKVPENCGTCKGRGFVSEFFWKHCVAEEVREMRAKTIEV